MASKRHDAAQIIAKLREAEVELARGKKTGEVCRKLGVTEQIYYRWRKEYGGLRTDQARRLKELERENARLKRVGGSRRAAPGVRTGESSLCPRKNPAPPADTFSSPPRCARLKAS